MCQHYNQMKNRLCFLKICILTLSAFTCSAQQFLNGDLEGIVTSSSILPQNWQNVPFTDINCQATQAGMDSPDLTDISGPGSSTNGLWGNPFSGLTFVSGMYGGDTSYFFQEGIMQNVSGFEINHVYIINFHQSVVKQDNALDQSGSWAIYIDNVLAGTTAPTFSAAPFNSTSFIWESKNITYTATAASHLVKFLPVDDDTNSNYSISDINGALRMGIDSIYLSSATDIKGYTNDLHNNLRTSMAYPNPTNSSTRIDYILPNGVNKGEIVFYDTQGKEVKGFNVDSTFNTLIISTEDLQSGLYYYNLQTTQGISGVKKLVKIK